MTYEDSVHPEYLRVRRDRGVPEQFVLLPSLEPDTCEAETVRRQLSRPFARSAAREAAVIRVRFASYMALPHRKIETLRPPPAVVDDIVAALQP